jgi:hypothetical protein
VSFSKLSRDHYKRARAVGMKQRDHDATRKSYLAGACSIAEDYRYDCFTMGTEQRVNGYEQRLACSCVRRASEAGLMLLYGDRIGPCNSSKCTDQTMRPPNKHREAVIKRIGHRCLSPEEGAMQCIQATSYCT